MSGNLLARPLAAIAVMAVVACGRPETKVPEAPDPNAGLPEITRQRVNDLVAINAAIQRYHDEHGEYPPSQNWQGYASPSGASLHASWIAGLDISPLPRDPANSDDPNGPQYLYVSSRSDYKLIAHNTGDCSAAVQVQGIQIDPARQPSADSCSAYGFWSEGLRVY
jgi:hypothetical protein